MNFISRYLTQRKERKHVLTMIAQTHAHHQAIEHFINDMFCTIGVEDFQEILDIVKQRPPELRYASFTQLYLQIIQDRRNSLDGAAWVKRRLYIEDQERKKSSKL